MTALVLPWYFRVVEHELNCRHYITHQSSQDICIVRVAMYHESQLHTTSVVAGQCFLKRGEKSKITEVFQHESCRKRKNNPGNFYQNGKQQCCRQPRFKFYRNSSKYAMNNTSSWLSIWGHGSHLVNNIIMMCPCTLCKGPFFYYVDPIWPLIDHLSKYPRLTLGK